MEEIRNGLWAKQLMCQERAAISRTIGEIMDRKMRGAKVDAASLYKKVGGQSEFTQRLFEQTFGSESEGVKGRISSDPAEDTPIEKINEALVEIARKLAERKVPNATGQATGLKQLDLKKLDGALKGDYICIKLGFSAGARAPWPDDPFVGGPTTWVFGASREQ